jgi:hypothetical protein
MNAETHDHALPQPLPAEESLFVCPDRDDVGFVPSSR